jgi:hypothetical protein
MYRMIDEGLWEWFQKDFMDWTEELFALSHKTICTALRDFLRDNGVYVEGMKYISQQLFNVLQEDKYKEWPAEEVIKQIKTGRDFNSYQNPIFRAKREDYNTIPQATPPPPPSQTVQQPQQQQMTTSNPTTTGTTTPQFTIPNPTPPILPTQGPTIKILTDLSKLYNSEALKFGNEINACQGISTYKIVLLRPSATFESVTSDLRHAIGVEMHCQNQVP